MSSKTSWNPDQYEKFKNERSQPFFDLMEMVQPIPHGRAVDLGCGTGELTSALHKYLQTDSCVGIDSSPAMLAKAEAFAGDGLSFKSGNILDWREPEKYGVIFSNAAIQWVDHHPQIFKNLYDSLVTHGQLAVQMPMNHDYPTHTIAHEMSHETHWKNLLLGQTYEQGNRMLSADAYARLLYKLGFKEQNVSMKVYGHILESREGVVEWVKGTMLTHFKSRLSPEHYEEFVREYKKRLFAVLPDEKPFYYPFKRIFLWARK